MQMSNIKCNIIMVIHSLCFILPITYSIGQSEINHVTFPSPNAYSLAKFVDIPVNHYTGVPEINIPIYGINTSEIKLSLDLSYHAGGVKVNEIPSWVGSGWALNAGGVITRATSGLNDDEPSKGFYYTGHLLNNNWPQPSGTYIENQRVGLVDGMPDMFYYNFNGRSGKFYFDNLGNIRTLPYSNIKFELTDTGSIFKNFGSVIFSFQGFKKWKVTDEVGIIYYFEELEMSKSETSTLGPNGGFGDVKELATSWYLTKIVAPNTQKEIVFEYDYSSFDATSSLYEYHSKAIGYFSFFGSELNQIGEFAENRSQTISRNYRHNLKRVIFPNGTVEFYASVKNDLPHPSNQTGFNSYKLDSMKILDNFFITKKSVIFKYINNSSQRLTLEQLIIDRQNSYTFEYYNMHLLPGYTSRNTDHWGYFNGASNNGLGLIPTFSYNSQSYQDITYYGINKEPNPDKMKFGILNKITYPTGGYTIYNFEPNDYSFVNSQPLAENGWSSWTYIDSSTTPSVTFNSLAQVELWYECSTDGIAYGNNIEPCLSVLSPWNFNFIGTFTLSNYIPQNTGNIDVKVKLRYRLLLPGSITKKFGGGVRVSKIQTFDLFNNTITKNFNYTMEGDSLLSSGVSGTDFKYHVQFVSGSPTSGAFATGVKAYSHSAFPLATTQGRHVGYQRVTETNVGNGKSIYEFTSFNGYPDQIGLQNNNYDMPLISKKSNDHKRGKPIFTTHMNNSGSVVSKNKVLGFRALSSGQSTKVWERSPFISFALVWGSNGSLPTYQEITLSETSAYAIDSESFLPGYEVMELHSGNEIFATDKSTYYNAFHQYKSSTTYNSDDRVYKEELKYPNEYSTPSTIMSNLIAKNIVGNPIEAAKYVNNSIISWTANKWLNQSGVVLLGEILDLELTTPLSSFSFSTDGSTFSNSFLRRSKFDYNSNFKIHKIEERLGVIKSVLWDYNNELPVCEVRNASPSTVSYTSFETQEKGGWTYTGSTIASNDAKTGKKYYNLASGGISKSGIPASTSNRFRLTFWARRSSGTGNWTFMGQSESLTTAWKLIERDVTGSTITISPSEIHLDELRLHPVNAEMTTYTYDPLVGIESITNPRNYTTYYKYDSTGKLKVVVDENNQINDLYQYNFRTTGLNP